MAPLIAEYDRHIDEMTEKLQKYEVRKKKFIEMLHAELRESVEKQIHALPTPSGVEGSTLEEDAIIKNLQEQVQLSEQERVQAMELWQTAAQELDRLQQLYQKSVSDGQTRDSQRLQLKVCCSRINMRRSVGLRLCVCRCVCVCVQEEEVAEAQGRENAADRRLQQLQAALSQLESKLKAASQEAEAVRREQTVWERKVGELTARCSALEEEKYDALSKVRESVQMAEEAALQKDQARLREKQKTEELEKTNEAMRQLIQTAAVRTRKEVENARKQCNVQIQRMAEELSALQLVRSRPCADKESQIERSLRERKAVEEELEKVYKEGRAEPDFRRIDELHQRCLDAERLREDLNLTLQSTQSRLKKMELDYSEELSRCQEEVRRLQGALAAARDDSVSVSEERLQLQQENLQLRREMDELRKTSLLVQKKAKQQVSQMEQEYSLKEQSLDARLRELEDSSRSSSADLTRLLAAQQKSTQRWKEEAKSLVQAFETKVTSLKAELSRQKQRSHELEMQLECDHNAVAEYERQLAESQEKMGRLQRRLTQSEQRAASAAQQLSVLTSQRRKNAVADPGAI
uniref:Sodium channel and clathrin linker 1 n=1 Tax=Salarias fasciatus TaxID=181472 RepID=A0A672H2Z6_SALFA